MSITSKQFLTSVLARLGRIEVDDSTRSLHTQGLRANASVSLLTSLKGVAAQQAKSAMLTLHFLFPHELLPALDLLDRRLVNEFRYQPSAESNITSSVFYIQSASAVTESVKRRSANSRFRNAYSATKVHYEVRLDAWNCTCAAFAQSQLKLLLRPRRGTAEADMAHVMSEMGDLEIGMAQSEAWFGGEATKPDSQIPICKHILAAAIQHAAPTLFSAGVQSKDISIGELAAWSMGWEES